MRFESIAAVKNEPEPEPAFTAGSGRAERGIYPRRRGKATN
jgi:hypothetical protein